MEGGGALGASATIHSHERHSIKIVCPACFACSATLRPHTGRKWNVAHASHECIAKHAVTMRRRTIALYHGLVFSVAIDEVLYSSSCQRKTGSGCTAHAVQGGAVEALTVFRVTSYQRSCWQLRCDYRRFHVDERHLESKRSTAQVPA